MGLRQQMTKFLEGTIKKSGITGEMKWSWGVSWNVITLQSKSGVQCNSNPYHARTFPRTSPASSQMYMGRMEIRGNPKTGCKHRTGKPRVTCLSHFLFLLWVCLSRTSGIVGACRSPARSPARFCSPVSNALQKDVPTCDDTHIGWPLLP